MSDERKKLAERIAHAIMGGLLDGCTADAIMGGLLARHVNLCEIIEAALAALPEQAELTEHELAECGLLSELFPESATTEKSSAVLAAPQAQARAQARIERLKAAIEGECDGLAITDERAAAVLSYVDEAAPAAPQAQDALDAARFRWWMSDAPKPPEFMNEFLRGVREGWSLDQWRALVDAARRQPK